MSTSASSYVARASLSIVYVTLALTLIQFLMCIIMYDVHRQVGGRLLSWRAGVRRGGVQVHQRRVQARKGKFVEETPSYGSKNHQNVLL